MTPVRSVRSLLLLGATATVVAGGIVACSGGNGPGGPTDSFDRRAMLTTIGLDVILPTYERFRDSAEVLKDATAAHRLAVGSSAGTATLGTARTAWIAAADVWQEAELFQVGPAGSPTMTIQGQDLRDEIYSWPTVNTCRVDQEIVEQQYGDAGFFDAELVNVYGLDALEYLLFVTAPNNTCPSQVNINQDGTWAALSATELAQRRADYADAVAGHVLATAQALVDAWGPGGGGFLSTFSSAGESGSEYARAQDAVNELFAAIYYLDLETKDMKLAEPAGISVDCPTATCPERVESRWAGRSKEHILANLRAFQRVFQGGDTVTPGIGFDDFLSELGAPDVTADMLARIDAAIAAVEAIPGPLEDAVASDLASVEAAHAAVKAVTDVLKTQMVSILNLKIPDEGAGDND